MENLIIIGGGPAGLAAAIYAARAELNPLVIEGAVPGGQLMLTTEVENYPGFVKGVLGPELMQGFRSQAERFNTRFLGGSVKKVTRAKNIIITLASGEELEAKSIIIATGADARWLNLESEQRLRGKGVSACATCDGFFFKNKTVAIVGGGDTAMEEANFLTRFATEVYLINRSEKFRASVIMQQRTLKNPKIKVIYNAVVEEVLGEAKVEGLKLRISGEKTETLTIGGLFVAIGHSPATAFLKDSGVALDSKGYIYTSFRAAGELAQGLKPPSGFNFSYQYQTSLPGVFAAGDCVDYRYRQATVASGMGVAAELEVQEYLENL
jgi:thioredoxin reductase (NADPH)